MWSALYRLFKKPMKHARLSSTAPRILLVFGLLFSLYDCGGLSLSATEGDFPPSPRRQGQDWMYNGKIGLSTHYVATKLEQSEHLANLFNVVEVARQAKETGAAWFLFTLHHESWIMMAPNSTYDRILGTGEYTSARDVPLELAKQLNNSNIKLMLYVNLRLSPKSAVSPYVRNKMGGWPPNDKLIENVAAVYREYSLRYGKNVAGWWVDGARLPEYRNSPNRERWFKMIADAFRAGNPEAIVAFNPGIEVSRYSLEDDYTAGETEELTPVPSGRFIDGAQWHAWTYLGGWWGSGGTRFHDKELGNYLSLVITNGGTVTLDVGTLGRSKAARRAPFKRTSPIGQIDQTQVMQIIRLKTYIPIRQPAP